MPAGNDSVKQEEKTTRLLRLRTAEIGEDNSILHAAADTVHDNLILYINLLDQFQVLPPGSPLEEDVLLELHVAQGEGNTITLRLILYLEGRKEAPLTMEKTAAQVMQIFDISEALAQESASLIMEKEIRFVPLRIVNQGNIRRDVSISIDGYPAPLAVNSSAPLPEGEYRIEVTQERIFGTEHLLDRRITLQETPGVDERVLSFSIPSLTERESREVQAIQNLLSQGQGAPDGKRRDHDRVMTFLAFLQSSSASPQYPETARRLLQQAAESWDLSPEEIQEAADEYRDQFLGEARSYPETLAAVEQHWWQHYPGNLRIYGAGGIFFFTDEAYRQVVPLLPSLDTGLHYRIKGPWAAGLGTLTLINKEIHFHIPGFIPLPYLSAVYHQSPEILHRLSFSTYIWAQPYLLTGYALEFHGFTGSLYAYYDWEESTTALTAALGYRLRL